MELLNVTILGDPIPKSRPKVGRGHGYTPRRTMDAEERVRQAALDAYAAADACSQPVGIAVNFYCATRRRSDGDNLLKLVTDAIQQTRRYERGVIRDDAQIEEWYCRVHRRVDGQEPRTEIRLYTLD